MMATRGCASLTPGYMPRLRLGLTCFACHRHSILLGVCHTPLHVHDNDAMMVVCRHDVCRGVLYTPGIGIRWPMMHIAADVRRT